MTPAGRMSGCCGTGLAPVQLEEGSHVKSVHACWWHASVAVGECARPRTPGRRTRPQSLHIPGRPHLQQCHARPGCGQLPVQVIAARVKVLQRAQAAVRRRQRAVQGVRAEVNGVEQLQGTPGSGQIARQAIVVQVSGSRAINQRRREKANRFY